MNTMRTPVLTGLLLVCGLALFTGIADARPLRSGGPLMSEVIIEGSAAMPYGDLGADWTEPAGFEAGQGWDVGVRYRQRFPGGWAVSPSFHYVDFGNFFTTSTTDGEMDVGTKMYRYGMDVQYFFPTCCGRPQFFLSAGAALVRNKMRVDYLDDDSYFDEGANSVAGAVGAGVRIGNFEISGEYNLNRFSTSRFLDGQEDLNWDYAVLRVGIGLPSAY